jgi:hypothetical protein
MRPRARITTSVVVRVKVSRERRAGGDKMKAALPLPPDKRPKKRPQRLIQLLRVSKNKKCSPPRNKGIYDSRISSKPCKGTCPFCTIWYASCKKSTTINRVPSRDSRVSRDAPSNEWTIVESFAESEKQCLKNNGGTHSRSGRSSKRTGDIPHEIQLSEEGGED